MEVAKMLKAIADETRFKILILLLQHNYCVRALARKLGLSESAISQHLKVLREAGLLIGAKRGYFMHYDVDRNALDQLASKIKEIGGIKRKACIPEKVGCASSEQKRCHVQKNNHKCSNQAKPSFHEGDIEEGSLNSYGNCQCHKS